VNTLPYNDYPQKLKAYNRAPQQLYYEGDITLLAQPSIAIIGTREPTAIGYNTALDLSRYFAEQGLVIVSGLAIGCDAAAHIAAVNATGKTIAVLGSPLHDIYPKENRELARRIVDSGGLLITEYSDSKYAPWRFKDRDYIQAAIADAVLPIQGWKGSGTRHACKKICELGRPLYIPSQNLDDHFNYPEKYELHEALWKRGDVTAIITSDNRESIANSIKAKY
jgi:DNA processing protein